MSDQPKPDEYAFPTESIQQTLERISRELADLNRNLAKLIDTLKKASK